jgi:hypothetical protein
LSADKPTRSKAMTRAALERVRWRIMIPNAAVG